MAAAGKWKTYQDATKRLGDGTFDLNTNTLKVALFQSTSNANTLSNSVLADLTNQVANGNGYTTGGVTLTGVTFNQAAGVAALNADDPSWTASGGNITARYAVLYQSGLVNGVTDALIAVCLLDTAPADVTAVDGNPLTLVLNASGFFTVTGQTTD